MKEIQKDDQKLAEMPVEVSSLDEQDRSTLDAVIGVDHGGSHKSDKFYFQIFLALAVITLVEIFLTGIGHAGLRAFLLLALSAGKFVLVVMFFMHLKGDRPIYYLVFLGPLLLAGTILVSLVGLFGNF